MSTLVMLLEERSMEELLKILLPRILPYGWDIRFIVFAGKQDLERNVTLKMRSWKLPDSAFLIVRDQDSAACTDVKERLMTLCDKAGPQRHLVRIACRELESFYFGDLEAVANAFNMPDINKMGNNRKYRYPGLIENPKGKLKKLPRN